MANDNHNNCAYGEQAVSYLYGEIDARGKAVFEEHLKNCSTCANEIIGFGTVRSSILQWKSEEFLLLKTPEIDIHNAPSAGANKFAASLFKTESRIDRFRKIFIPSTVWAAGFIFFIVLGGLFLFVYNFSNYKQIEKVKIEDSQIVNPLSTTLKDESEIAGKTLSEETIRIFAEKLPESEKLTNKNLSEKISEPKKAIVRAARAAKREQITVSKTFSENSRLNISAAAGKSKNLNSVAVAKVPARKLRIPQIDNIDEGEEDATLRLTDLFDEVGDK